MIAVVAVAGWAIAAALFAYARDLYSHAVEMERLLEQFHVAYQTRRMSGDRS